jgi:erythrocyte band 7 integral membrane protein
MYYKVKDATSAVAKVDDYSGSAQLLAATTLRNVLGTRNLGDILSDREAIAREMQVYRKRQNLSLTVMLHIKSGLGEATDPWGVLVERVEVKDVHVPENLQRAMAAEAEAARNARAKVIAAEGEHKASRALKHAADVIIDRPGALQVNYDIRKILFTLNLVFNDQL